jgi:DNA-binding NtrC family response regulator
MTAYSSSQLTQEARDEGAVEVLSKPVDIDDICGLIEQSAATRPVLVVDDDPRFRQSLTRALRTKGFHVHTAQGIDDTLEEFQSRPGCVVLLDMKLDGCSGLDVLARIRSVNQDVFAVLMTGFDELEPAMQAGLDSGAVRTLTKPFELDALVDIINSRPNASAE